MRYLLLLLVVLLASCDKPRSAVGGGIVKGKYADPTPAKKGNYEITEDSGFRDLAKDDLYISKETMEEKFPGVLWVDFDKMGVTGR